MHGLFFYLQRCLASLSKASGVGDESIPQISWWQPLRLKPYRGGERLADVN